MRSWEEELGLHAQLACVWEVTARKPGNVHRYRDFSDTKYLDFVISAAAIGPILGGADTRPLGETVLACVRRTQEVAQGNPNLGIVLVLAPLAKASWGGLERGSVERVLQGLTREDAEGVYEAIRLANPGGLGEVPEGDIRDRPRIGLREAMILAESRDLVARQYANGFREVFEEGVPGILTGVGRTGCLEGGIIYAYIDLMSRYPDSLIARKRGKAEAMEAARRAQRVLELGWPATVEGKREMGEFDQWLRAEGNERNPGTTADLIAGSLLVLLRTGRLSAKPEFPWEMIEGMP